MTHLILSLFYLATGLSFGVALVSYPKDRELSGMCIFVGIMGLVACIAVEICQYLVR